MSEIDRSQLYLIVTDYGLRMTVSATTFEEFEQRLILLVNEGTIGGGFLKVLLVDIQADYTTRHLLEYIYHVLRDGLITRFRRDTPHPVPKVEGIS